MTVWHEEINPEDHSFIGMSRSPALEEMPAELLCPSGHRAERHIIEHMSAEYGGIRVPVWVCTPCSVAYRYQECKLPPGEEGHA